MPLTTLEAFVTPHLLKWARDRWDYSIEAVAKKINVNPSQLEAWEKGDSKARPTFRQARDLAKKLNIPFGYLFLSEPPRESVPLPDLRTIKGKNPLNPSPN